MSLGQGKIISIEEICNLTSQDQFFRKLFPKEKNLHLWVFFSIEVRLTIFVYINLGLQRIFFCMEKSRLCKPLERIVVVKTTRPIGVQKTKGFYRKKLVCDNFFFQIKLCLHFFYNETDASGGLQFEFFPRKKDFFFFEKEIFF